VNSMPCLRIERGLLYQDPRTGTSSEINGCIN
jgi:hypothetical protein